MTGRAGRRILAWLGRAKSWVLWWAGLAAVCGVVPMALLEWFLRVASHGSALAEAFLDQPVVRGVLILVIWFNAVQLGHVEVD